MYVGVEDEREVHAPVRTHKLYVEIEKYAEDRSARSISEDIQDMVSSGRPSERAEGKTSRTKGAPHRCIHTNTS